jgi:hypothetical protein
MSALLVSATTYVYLTVLVNAVETLEAMRFREEVEPVVWLITLICVSELAAAARLRIRDRVQGGREAPSGLAGPPRLAVLLDDGQGG